MRVPASAGTPEERRRHHRRLLWIAIAVGAVVIGSALAYILLQPGAPLNLLGVSVSPDPAVPDQPIRVTAQVQGGTFLAPLSVELEYESFFTGGPSGGSTMFRGSNEAYSAEMGPFANGTAVWFLVLASDGHRYQLSANFTVDVGTPSHGLPSGLRINSVVLEPTQPTSLDSPALTVNVTSSVSVTSVYLSTMFFYLSSNSRSSGGTGGGMVLDPHGNYTTMPGLLYGMGPGSYGTTVGTIWLYRVAVQDGAGNAVLSPVYNFTVALPPL